MSETITLKIYAYLGAVWTDITSDVSASGVSASWGIRSNRPFDRLAGTGQLNFTMNNADGAYLPGGASVVSSDWKKGCKVKAVFTYGGVDYPRFYGTIDKMDIDAGTSGERKVHVTALDWMDYAAKYPLDNPAIQEDKTADQALTTIVNAMPIAPLATSFDIGTNTFPLVFSDATLKTRAYSEFQKLAMSELGYIYIRHNPETLVFENSEARPENTPVSTVRIVLTSSYMLMETGDKLLLETGDKILLEGYTDTDAVISNTMIDMDVSYGDNLINRVTTSVYPPRIDTNPSLVFDLDSPIYVPAEGTRDFRVDFTDQSSKRLVAALPPDDSYPTTLIHFEDSTASNPIVEDSGKSWGVQGGAGLTTTYKKFGARSGYLDGGTNTYFDAITSDDYNFGSGDFTVEWWEYRFNADSGEAMINRDKDVYTSFPPYLLGKSDGTNSLIYLSSDGATWDIANGKTFGAIATNTWVHYALCRSGNTFYAFTNGTLKDTWTSSATIKTTTGGFAIGKYGSAYITACIDEFRMVKGQAKYTSNFTVADEAFSLSGTFFNAYELSNRGGTELTNDFDVTITYGGAGASVSVTNSNVSLGGYLTALKIYSYIVESVSPVTDVQENSTSYLEYGFHEESLQQIYKDNFDAGSTYAASILDTYKDPKTEVNKVTLNANKNENQAMYFLSLDVGDAVEIAETQTGIDAAYFINGVEWTAIPSSPTAGSAIVNYSWIVKEFRRNGLSNSYFDFNRADQASNTFANWLDFGYLEAVQADSVTNRLFTAWVRLDAINQTLGSDHATFISTGYQSDGTQTAFGVYRNTPAYLGYWQGGSTAQGQYRGSTALSINTNYFVAVWMNKSSISNTPVFYLNGAAETTTTENAAAGTVLSDLNFPLTVGGLYTARSGGGTNGRIADARVYNVDEMSVSPASLVASLYAAGAYGAGNTQGLVFQLGAVPNEYYTAWLDNPLDPADDKTAVDLIGGTVGIGVKGPSVVDYPVLRSGLT